MIRYYLVNLDYQTIWQGPFDRELIKAKIVNYLQSEPEQELTLEKDNSDPKTYGNDVIDTFCNKDGVICRILTVGNKTFHRPLRIPTP